MLATYVATNSPRRNVRTDLGHLNSQTTMFQFTPYRVTGQDGKNILLT